MLLLSISDDGYELEVDYNKSPEQLYTNIALHYAGTQDLASLLYCAAFQRWQYHHDLTRVLPSWIPDWRIPADSAAHFPSKDVVAEISTSNRQYLVVDVWVTGLPHALANPVSLNTWLSAQIKNKESPNCKACMKAILAYDEAEGASLLLPSSRKGIVLEPCNPEHALRRHVTFRLGNRSRSLDWCNKHITE